MKVNPIINMSDTGKLDLGAPAQAIVDSKDVSKTTPEKTKSTPIDTKGALRPLKDIHEVSVVGEATFRLEQDTELEFRRLVQEHFALFDTVGTGILEEWEESFILRFRDQLRASIVGRDLSTVVGEERTALIAREAEKFVANNQNLQTLVRLAEFDLRAIQTAVDADIIFRDPMDHSRYSGTRRSISGGRDKRMLGPARLLHTVAKKLDNLDTRFSNAINQGRINNTSDYDIKFPDTKEVGGTLSESQVIRLKSLGLVAGDNYENRPSPLNPDETMTSFVAQRLAALTTARVDFYKATNFDISRIKIDFKDTSKIQDPHTQVEREALREGATDAEDARKKISEAVVKQVEDDLLTKHDDEVRIQAEKDKRDSLDRKIEQLSRKKTDEEVKADKKRLEEEKEKLEERKKKAEEREVLEKQKEEAKAAIKAAESVYAAGDPQMQKDFDAYDAFVVEQEEAEVQIQGLRAEKIAIDATLARIKALSDRLNEIRKNAPVSRTIKDEGTTKPSEKVEEDYLREKQEVEKAIKERENRFKDELGNVIPIDEYQGIIEGRILTADERIKAKGPKGWDSEKTARIQARRAALEQIPQIDIQIKNGIDDGSFDEASSEEIQKLIVAKEKEIEEVANTDVDRKQRAESLQVFKEYIASDDATDKRNARLDLIKADRLPMPESKLYENWPRVHLRIIQGVFGSEAIRFPEEFRRVTKLLSPEDALVLINAHRKTSLTMAEFAALPASDIKAEDIQSIVDSLSHAAYEEEDLSVMSEEEKQIREKITALDPGAEVPKVESADAKELDRFHYYYRDVIDLQIRILRGWEQAASPPVPVDSYLDTSDDINLERIRKASAYALEVDRLRKKKQLELYGKVIAD